MAGHELTSDDGTREGIRVAGERRVGGSNSVVESQPSKLLVAGSIPVSRSNPCSRRERRVAGQLGFSAAARSAKADGHATERIPADSSAEAPEARRPM